MRYSRRFMLASLLSEVLNDRPSPMPAAVMGVGWAARESIGWAASSFVSSFAVLHIRAGSPAALPALQRAAKTAGIALSEIGAVSAGAGVEILGLDNRPLELLHPSFSHF